MARLARHPYHTAVSKIDTCQKSGSNMPITAVDAIPNWYQSLFDRHHPWHADYEEHGKEDYAEDCA